MRLILLLCACTHATSTAVDAGSDSGNSDYLVTVSPSQLTVRQHVGAAGEPAFAYRFTVPADLAGGGLPADLTSGKSKLAVLELELPLGGGTTDEDAMASTGVRSFDATIFCHVGDTSCDGKNGHWKATAGARELQLAASEVDNGRAG